MRKIWTQRHRGRRPCADSNGSHAATRRGKDHWPHRSWKGGSEQMLSKCPRRNTPCRHLDFRLLAAFMVRAYISAILRHLVMATPRNEYISLIHPTPAQSTRAAWEVSKGQGKSRPASFLVTLSAKIKLPLELSLFSVSLFWFLAIIFKSSQTQKPEIHIYFSEIGSP